MSAKIQSTKSYRRIKPSKNPIKTNSRKSSIPCSCKAGITHTLTKSITQIGVCFMISDYKTTSNLKLVLVHHNLRTQTYTCAQTEKDVTLNL